MNLDQVLRIYFSPYLSDFCYLTPPNVLDIPQMTWRRVSLRLEVVPPHRIKKSTTAQQRLLFSNHGTVLGSSDLISQVRSMRNCYIYWYWDVPAFVRRWVTRAFLLVTVFIPWIRQNSHTSSQIQDYVITPYIGEFVNTLSSLTFGGSWLCLLFVGF